MKNKGYVAYHGNDKLELDVVNKTLTITDIFSGKPRVEKLNKADYDRLLKAIKDQQKRFKRKRRRQMGEMAEMTFEMFGDFADYAYGDKSPEFDNDRKLTERHERGRRDRDQKEED